MIDFQLLGGGGSRNEGILFPSVGTDLWIRSHHCLLPKSLLLFSFPRSHMHPVICRVAGP
jgi:hypothetical protein